MDEDTLRRWMALEVKDLRDRLARRRRPLSELLQEEDPRVETQGAGPRRLDPDELERWREAVRPHERHRLRLPVFVVRSREGGDSAFVEDELAAEALQRMGLVREDLTLRDGVLWMGTPLAVEVLRELETTTQMALR